MILNHLYTLTCKEGTRFCVRLSDASHPIFQAHFPTNPILPGFILLDLSAEILGIEIVKIQKAKFLKNITPLSVLWFDTQTHEKTLKIRVTQNEQKVAELTYEKR
ncbi:3-hydroxyacyl-ACP dehydratase [Sulfurospirillum diekertiae]|uniref:3-hydroxyacyl-ACP dehydratase n=1 Tax=Sulfurospirillum diekertiae TaxID=1854492 RepID=A0A6G9VSC8_9BACT|nr:3-hydroxyacyl-ACP dehydratase [Sulfurospirillum diekertiae]QIR75772.1 3-hydroxyacyl-ACP dehydratase [Sulfurospirillum diekertiae]QIR78417.1 3-hydroxyacyl-ACP dehydratase [Sulfurospirillum diekertiae]